jgi:hypothetical protein
LGGDPTSCARQIQGFLDRYFAPFNVYFTLTPPANYPFNTVVITGGNAWCGGTTDLGWTPLTCSYRLSDDAFALKCDNDPAHCAALVAHEYGHLVGLAHTDSVADIMYQTPCSQCDGYQNADMDVVPKQACDRSMQDSYELMCKALGARSSVAPPAGAFTCSDLFPPQVGITEPQDGATITSEAISVAVDAQDDCGVWSVSATLEDSYGVKTDPPIVTRFPPYKMFLPSASPGPASVTVTAKDNTGKETSATVHFQVIGASQDAGNDQ